MTLPLDGQRVVDLTGYGGADGLGVLCGRILADLGADVVHVEPPGGSPLRRRPPLTPGTLTPGTTSLWFAHRAVNERAVVLDLDAREGRADLEVLVAGADALVESSGPGGLAAIDESLGSAGLSLAYPHLVVCSISHFGADGPHAHWAGTDLVDAAAGGMIVPLRTPAPATARAAGFDGVRHRGDRRRRRRARRRGTRASGAGRASGSTCPPWRRWPTSPTGRLPMFSALGNDQVRDGGGTLYPIYRCADGTCAWCRR